MIFVRYHHVKTQNPNPSSSTIVFLKSTSIPSMSSSPTTKTLSFLFLLPPNPNPNLPYLLSSLPSLSFPSLLKAHSLLTTSGLLSSSSSPRRLRRLSRHLIRLFAPHSLPHSLLLHSHLPSPDPVSSNHILTFLVRHHPPSDVIRFFARGVHPTGCRPNERTFPILIAAAKLTGSVHQGETFHCLAVKLGFFAHIPVPNSLIHLYASCDALDLARQLFDEMPVRDRVSFNSIVDGYVQSGDFEAAEELFWRNWDRNAVSWSTLFNGYVRNRMFGKGLRFFRRMQEDGVEPDDCSIVSLLVVYAHFKWELYGKSVHGYLVRKWSRIPVHVSSALVKFYCNSGLLTSALNLFVKMEAKDLISYNTMISGLGRNGKGAEALSIFSRMLDNGLRPDDITFLGVLIACSHSEMIEEGVHYFEIMRSKFGIMPTFAHYWCLVDLFIRVHRPHDALKMIHKMPLDSLSSIWGVIIGLAKVNGDISVGEVLGKRLIELEPDNSRRYVPLANLYAAASTWDKYKELQDELKARRVKKLPDCTLIDLNVGAHKFSVGDKSQVEIGKIYEVLSEFAEQLKLQPPDGDENGFGLSQ